MRKIILPALILLLPVAAQAAPSDAYYQQQYKSCQHMKQDRTSWRDFFMATHPVITDRCCVESVDAMKAAGATRVKDDECPAGYKKTRLSCETSKSWCVKN